MKKLLIIALILWGCDNSTEPAPEDCINDTLSNELVGNWAGSIKLDTNYWNDIEIPDSIAYFLMTVDSNNMVHMEGYKCDGYDCNRIDGGGEESYEMITIEYHDTTYLVQTDFDDETPTFNLSKGFAYELEGNLLTIIDFGLSPVNRFTVERCEAEGSSSYCYFGCTDESNINFDPTAIYNNGSCKYEITGRVVDSQGEAIKDAAILLTYDYGNIVPTNSTSLADFSLNTSGNVYIYIESMCGDTVNILIDDYMEAGMHQISWDFTDLDGNIVFNGQYEMHYIDADNAIYQNIYVGQSDYSNLDNIEGYNYHAKTDDNGLFSIQFDCLPFNMEYFSVDEFGNPIGWLNIPYTVKIWMIHDDYITMNSGWKSLDPNNDLYVEFHIP